jgi:hypothetical protein
MMSSRRQLLIRRQQELLAVSARLRQELQHQVVALKSPLAWLGLLPLLVLSLQRRGRSFGWVSALFWRWRVLQQLRAVWTTFRH